MFQLSSCYSVFMTKESRPASYNFTIYCDKYKHLFNTTRQSTIYNILMISRHLEDRQGVKEKPSEVFVPRLVYEELCVSYWEFRLCSEQRTALKYFKGKSHFLNVDRRAHWITKRVDMGRSGQQYRGYVDCLKQSNASGSGEK